jgi:hypothetical protein
MSFGQVNLNNADASYAFEKVFGQAGIAEEQIYYPGLRGGKKACAEGLQKIGKRLKDAGVLAKAPSMSTTTGGTVTAYGLMPPFIDPSIVDRTIRETPLVKLLARRAVRGRSYVYNALTAKAGAVFLGDDGAIADQVDTYTATNVAIKYLYAKGRVTGPAQASGFGFLDLMAQDMRVKTTSINEALENEIINGNTTTNALGFQGLIQSITTNTTDNSGAAITLAQIRTDMNTAFEANGTTDLVVTDGSTFNVIKGLLMDFQRNVEKPSGTMDFGIPDAFTFDGALFIKDRYMPTTASSRRILYLDTRYVFLAVLQDVTFEDMAKTNDSVAYFLKWYGVMVVNFESAMVMRYGLA